MVKRIFRYLNETVDLGLNVAWNDKFEQPVVLAYSDADWAGDVTDCKSTSGSVVAINGIPAVWKSKKQVGVALSSYESE